MSTVSLTISLKMHIFEYTRDGLNPALEDKFTHKRCRFLQEYEFV